jgi:hypothetical protein
MSERVLEITTLLAPLLGIILGAVAPPLVSHFLPADVPKLSKWATYVVIGGGGTLGAVFVYWIYTGNINYWWGVVGFFSAAGICWVYLQYLAYPFKRFRVTCLENDDKIVIKGKMDGKGLIANQQRGEYDRKKKRWVISKDWGVWGPYIHLEKGWYKATFRIKVTGLEWEKERRFCEIDVVAWSEDWMYEKPLAHHLLTTKDFRGVNRYNKFPLVFRVYFHEDKVEFRLRQISSQHTIIFDYVKLSRITTF